MFECCPQQVIPSQKHKTAACRPLVSSTCEHSNDKEGKNDPGKILMKVRKESKRQNENRQQWRKEFITVGV